MRRYASAIVFVLIMVTGELHRYFSLSHTSNWILHANRPMSDAWNVKFAGLQLMYILYPLAALLWHNNYINKATAITFVVFAVMDTLMYFWNYKTAGYGVVYLWYMVIWVLVYKAIRLWQRRHLMAHIWQQQKHSTKP